VRVRVGVGVAVGLVVCVGLTVDLAAWVGAASCPAVAMGSGLRQATRRQVANPSK
jgi:hypothetical protein